MIIVLIIEIVPAYGYNKSQNLKNSIAYCVPKLPHE
jgi:hypothetical protein